MMCPHCKKPISKRHGNSQKVKSRVLELSDQGYSCRDIEALLNREIGHSTVAKIIRDEQKEK